MYRAIAHAMRSLSRSPRAPRRLLKNRVMRGRQAGIRARVQVINTDESLLPGFNVDFYRNIRIDSKFTFLFKPLAFLAVLGVLGELYRRA
jgi:hypothetical protein